jgi:hypothetical protein
MSQQQQLLKQDMTISQILRTYGKQFTQIQMRYFDGQEGKYAIAVIGWWNEIPRSKEIMPLKQAWSKEECMTMH